MDKEVTTITDNDGAVHLTGDAGQGLCGAIVPEGATVVKMAERHFHDHRAACIDCRVKLAGAVLDLLRCGRLNDTQIGEARRYVKVGGKVYQEFRD